MLARSYVTVVSGVPRSGTSMMMRMLAAGGLELLTDGVRAADSDNPRGYFEYEPVKSTREDPSWVRGAVGKAVKAIYLYLPDLPLDRQYRVILMQRDLQEVVRSQELMLRHRGRPASAFSPGRLVEIYQGQVEEARRYLAAHPEHFRYLEVDYNRMMQAPRLELEVVSRFLDGLDMARMLSVVDSSLYHQRGDTESTGV